MLKHPAHVPRPLGLRWQMVVTAGDRWASGPVGYDEEKVGAPSRGNAMYVSNPHADGGPTLQEGPTDGR